MTDQFNIEIIGVLVALENEAAVHLEDYELRIINELDWFKVDNRICVLWDELEERIECPIFCEAVEATCAEYIPLANHRYDKDGFHAI